MQVYIYILDIRISADASRRTIATKGSCMPSRYTRKTMATHCTLIQVIIIIIILRMRSACAEALQTYIYIYTHRESLVRNHEPCAKALGNNYIYVLDVRISADASRRTIATKGSCMPSRYTRKTMATHCTHIQVIIIIIILRMRCACAEALQTYIYIYIYTHRESLVRNHEPCAKALGNNVVMIPLRTEVCAGIIESVDSINRDERGFPLTQYITNGRISRARYTITHFKHHHRILRLISIGMSV